MNAGELVFVDTNILLYSLDSADPARQIAAREWMSRLWQQASGRLSRQVLNEFYVNAVRKVKVAPPEVCEAAHFFFRPAG